MLKGIKALFVSGMIFRPSILSGVIIGLLMTCFLDIPEVFRILTNINLYLIIVILMAVYTFFFNRRYVEKTDDLDYKSMGKKYLDNIFTLIFSMYLSFIFFGIVVKFTFFELF